jgi:dTDP-4-dehydrorhamnose reductase
MIRILVTRVYAQLARALDRIDRQRGISTTGHGLATLAIRDPDAVRRCVLLLAPTTFINCAAHTAVDDCESNREAAYATNAEAVDHLAEACNRTGSRLVQISTDYVFSGDGDRPYAESDPTAALGVYGRSKLRGEELAANADRHMIVRTAWLYGHGGRNFVETIRGQLESGTSPLRVVADQTGSPTFCDDLAAAVLDLDHRGITGVVHAVNTGATTWHAFAVEIAHQLGALAEIVPVTTTEFPRPAPRPAYSVLDTSLLTSLLGRPMPPWQDALARYLTRASHRDRP